MSRRISPFATAIGLLFPRHRACSRRDRPAEAPRRPERRYQNPAASPRRRGIHFGKTMI